MWHSRTFWRLFSTYGLLSLASIGILGGVIVSRVEQHFLQQVEDTLHTRAVLVREYTRAVLAQENVADGPGQRDRLLEDRVATLGREIGTRITLLAGDGRVLADSDKDPEEM